VKFDRKKIGNISEWKVIMLFESTLDVSIFTLIGLTFTYSKRVEPLETLEGVIGERVLDSFSTAFHK
jgi:hypothetical protein